jgi:hypothetical protein
MVGGGVQACGDSESQLGRPLILKTVESFHATIIRRTVQVLHLGGYLILVETPIGTEWSDICRR